MFFEGCCQQCGQGHSGTSTSRRVSDDGRGRARKRRWRPSTSQPAQTPILGWDSLLPTILLQYFILLRLFLQYAATTHLQCVEMILAKIPYQNYPQIDPCEDCGARSNRCPPGPPGLPGMPGGNLLGNHLITHFLARTGMARPGWDPRHTRNGPVLRLRIPGWFGPRPFHFFPYFDPLDLYPMPSGSPGASRTFRAARKARSRRTGGNDQKGLDQVSDHSQPGPPGPSGGGGYPGSPGGSTHSHRKLFVFCF